jgi:hypothetical protein
VVRLVKEANAVEQAAELGGSDDSDVHMAIIARNKKVA